MCFNQPDIPKEPDAPSVEDEDAKARVAAEQETARQMEGRMSTILTSPLGVPDSERQRNRQRTTIGGM